MRRRDFITLLGGAAAAWPLAAQAQRALPARMKRVGVLMGYVESDPLGQRYYAALLQGLQQTDWIPGQNVQLENRWVGADPSLVRTAVADLVGLKPDLILATTGLVMAQLQQQAGTIPLVFTQITDPVGAGYVNSLARPGGNVTGFATGEFSMFGKFPEMLKQIAPSVTRAAVILNLDQAAQVGMWRVIEEVAPLLKLQVTQADLHDAAEINAAVEAFARTPNGSLIVLANPITNLHRGLIIALAARYRLPASYPYSYFVQEGGLISYGVDPADLFRGVASYVDRILRGEKPADLPVQQPTKYQLAINLRTAKALGLTVPPTMLTLADQVIE
jgi:putative tryptophan/tyrosine transport system substrate-binding protein